MKHHIVPLRVYMAVFTTLLVMTGVTVAVAFMDLGTMNTFVAVTIAIFKATIVVLYFMHVRYSGKLIWVFAGAGFLWLLILFAFTLSDTMTRGWLPDPGSLPL